MHAEPGLPSTSRRQIGSPLASSSSRARIELPAVFMMCRKTIRGRSSVMFGVGSGGGACISSSMKRRTTLGESRRSRLAYSALSISQLRSVSTVPADMP
jgi:hypothetical protein